MKQLIKTLLVRKLGELMLGYIVFTLFVLLIALVNVLDRRFYKISEVLTLTTAIVFSAIRYNVGWDYEFYYALIEKRQFNRFELIPQLFADVSHRLGSPFVFFVVTSLWINLFYYFALKKFEHYALVPFVLYIFYPFIYLPSFSSVRQGMANAVFIYSVSLLLRENYLLFVIFGLVSSFCHQSSVYPIIIMAFLWGFWKTLNKQNEFKMFQLTLIILFIFLLPMTYLYLRNFLISLSKNILQFYGQKYVIYIDSVITEGGQKAKFLNLALFMVLLLLRTMFPTWQNTKRDPLDLIILGLFLGIVFELTFSSFGHIGLRISQYFYSLFPVALYKVIPKERGLQKCLILLTLLGLSIAMFYLMLYIDWQSFSSGVKIKMSYLPYRTIFEMILNKQ